jgi:glycosyltransferase involved in cell wall biosynthesis
MKIDVIMPVKGDSEYIIESILSILDNLDLYDNLTIVLDRASDSTQSIVQEFLKYDSRIRCLVSIDPGISNALNFGISRSNAELIARMDSDDVVNQNRFNTQRRFLYRNQDYILVGSDINFIDKDGNRIKSKIYPKSDKSIRKSLIFFNSFAHPSVMIRRNALINCGLYRDNFDGQEDYELWSRLSNFGRVKNLRRKLINYRIHPGQVTKSLKLNQVTQNEIKRLNAFNYLIKLHKKNPKKASKKTNRLTRISSDLDSELYIKGKILVLVKGFLRNPKTIYTVIFYFVLNMITPKFLK